MRVRISRAIVAVAISCGLGVGTLRAQAPSQPAQQAAQPAQQGPQWKDRAEYDLVQNILKTTDGAKKLELLDQWKQKYPQTDFGQLRLEQYLEAHRLTNNAKGMIDTAKELLALDPKNVNGLYWTNLLVVSMNDTSPGQLQLGETAANTVINNIDTLKPQATPEDAWQKLRGELLMTAHRTKGWVAMQRKEYEPAEKEFREVLKANGNNAEASFWLATVMLAQKNPDKQSEALFHFARAAAYEGPGALPPPQRQKVLEYIKKTYTSFHGDDPQGFQQLLDTAKAQTFPPQDFKILSEAEVLHQKEEELKKTNPQLAFWMLLKQALTAPTGDDYFNSGVKGALLPPADQPPLKGFVISQEPARAPKTVVLGMTNSANPEVTIEFEEPLPTRADPGTTIEFRGVAKAFTREPFMLTFDVERDNLTGWPSPQRKAPGRKAVKKK